MSRTVAFLTTPVEPHNDNHLRLPDLFARAGWQVDSWPHDALSWQRGTLYIGDQPAHRYDLVWPVGLGPQATFFDRQELLVQLAPGQCINAPQSYLFQHGKSTWLSHAPNTFISHEPQILIDALAANPGEWVLKPLAGSFGRQVHRVTSPAEVASLLAAQPRQYWMLQAFIADIGAGETRTLVCADEIIGSYLRMPNDGWHANLTQNATPHATKLNATDEELVTQVRTQLREAGIRFAAIDTAGGYVMEVNIANPGGLGTLAALYGEQAIRQRMAKAIERLGE